MLLTLCTILLTLWLLGLLTSMTIGGFIHVLLLLALLALVFEMITGDGRVLAYIRRR